ncbi:hypothetical protein CALCODRAFT_510454 [Calocera cornea HHB12733]|uniref:CCAAT-binding factor domain-containing protein n=1 Tax=Calocera cornea HHB12733 TaxID=1353952 RepID=A0A165EH57_9BASI|nr:hypothetical protein CALCODRAFT_510454 [Calocera cornea HHB12733]
MPPAPLSPEIWLMILEEAVLGDSQCATNLSADLTLVCRTWKNLVEPLLYRRLLFWSSRQITLFVNQVYALKRSNQYPTRRTTSLCLAKIQSGLDSRDMMFLFRCLPKLQHLDSSLKLSWKELEIIADTCCNQLRVLDICLDDTDGSGLAFSILNRFQRLEHMHLCISDSFPKRTALNELLPFTFPNMKYLELRMAKQQRGLCSYPALEHLRLSRLLLFEVTTLSQFLFIHGPQLTRLDVENFTVDTFPTDYLPNLKHLGLMQNVSDMTFDAWEVVAILPPSVRVLHLCESAMPSSGMTSLLQDISRQVARLPCMQAIQIEDPGFRWEHLTYERDQSIASWVRSALELRKGGIALLDADGMRFTPDTESEQEQDVKVVAPVLPSNSSKYGLFNLSDDEEDYASEPYEVDSDSDMDVPPSPPCTSSTKRASLYPEEKRYCHTAEVSASTTLSRERKRSNTTCTNQNDTHAPPDHSDPSLESLFPIRCTAFIYSSRCRRSVSKTPSAPSIRSRPGLVVYDSDSDEEDDNVMPHRDYSTIPDYQPTEPQAFREAKWTAYRDPLEEWERQAKQASLRRAHNSYRLHETRIEQQRRSKAQEILRTIEESQSREVEEVERLLASMRMQQEEEDRVLKQAHEQRKRDLWERVDQALAFESEAQARAEAKRLEEARKRKEEEERREAERVAAEKRRKEEQERQAREAKQREERERQQREETLRKEQEEMEATEKRRAEAEAAAARRAELAQREAEQRRKDQRWDVWTTELQDESEVMRGKAESMRKAVEAVEEGDKPRPVKKACSDARRAMRKAFSTITRELSVIARIAKQCQEFLAQAAQADMDAYGYLLHHLGATVVERAEEVTDLRDVYPIAHCCRLLMTEGGGDKSVANALYFAIVRETWVIEGVKPGRPEGMSTSDWEQQYGKRREEEPSLAYAARIANYMAFYAALCQSDIAFDDGRVPPQWTLDALWKRLTSLLRTPQDADWLTPHVVAAILQVSGKRLEEVYGGAQFSKLRAYLLGLCTPGDGANPHWLGREDTGETAGAGREKLTAILQGWEGDRLSAGREWEDDVPGGSYASVEGGGQALVGPGLEGDMMAAPTKRKKLSNAHDQDQDSDRDTVAALEAQLTQALDNSASLNPLIDLLALAADADADAGTAHGALYALYRVWCIVIGKGLLSAPVQRQQEAGEAALVRAWLQARWDEYMGLLGKGLHHPEPGIRTAALEILMSLLKPLSAFLSKRSGQPRLDGKHFRFVVRALLVGPDPGPLQPPAGPGTRMAAERSAERPAESVLMQKDVGDLFLQKWLSVDDDVRWFFLREAAELLHPLPPSSPPAPVAQNLLSLLERLDTMPTTSKELDSFWIPELSAKPSKPSAAASASGTSGAEDAPDPSDWLAFFDDPAPPTDERERDKPSKRTTKLSVLQSLHHLPSHRSVFSATWLALLPHLRTPALASRALAVLHKNVLPGFTRPLRLMDWIAGCVDHGGVIGLLALNALFTLMRDHNLDYPDFYKRLYGFLTRDVLHLKYRARFFRLTELFLSSTHLPVALLASFIKRLARLSLSAPPAAIVMILPLTYNILKQHPSLMPMIHREPAPAEGEVDPFRADETDPMLTGAVGSSLWELNSHREHYLASVSTMAKILSEPFTKPSYALEDFLDHTYGTMFEAEIKRRVKHEPALAMQYEGQVFPSSTLPLGAEKEDGSRIGDVVAELWGFGVLA